MERAYRPYITNVIVLEAPSREDRPEVKPPGFFATLFLLLLDLFLDATGDPKKDR